MRVALGKSGILDHVSTAPTLRRLRPGRRVPAAEADAALQPEATSPSRPPDPDYDEDGNFIPNAYVQEILQSGDPNEKYGTQGGGNVHAVRSESPLGYTVGFQNKPTASAPAQTIKITDQLDPAKLDLSTFSLGPIAFGTSC